MRMRASELATEWLGPRTELEIRQGLLREVEQERLTGLDRALLRQASVNIVDLSEEPSSQQCGTVLRARLQRLEAMELAQRIDGAMHKALRGQQRECVVPESVPDIPVIGRIAGKGLVDELHDRSYLVVDGIDGRAHYV